MINIAICDDETVFAESLSVQIKNEIIQNNETCTEYICSNGTTLIELCQNESIDVAFVDISMPEMNGFDIAEKLKELNKNILLVFVSGNDRLVFQSYEYQPFWFIPKSQMQLLKIVIVKIIEKMNMRDEEKRTINVSLNKRMIGVNLKEIYYIKNDDHYIRLITDKSEQSESYRCKLDVLEDQLRDYWFVRTHKRFLVNCRAIKEIEKSKCILKNDEEIPISRAKIADVKNKFQDYMRWVR